MSDAPQSLQQAQLVHQCYWRRVRGFTIGLLLLWFGGTFGVLFFARELAHITFFGWPFSFYMAAQGLTLFYLLLVGVYVLVMRLLDRSVKDDSDA